MSFSSDVKKELTGLSKGARHCVIAEMAAIFGMCGAVSQDGEGLVMELRTENPYARDRFSYLLRSAFGAGLGEDGRTVGGSAQQVRSIAGALHLTDSKGAIADRPELADGMLAMNSCCRRSFLRGAFIAGGSISDPEKSYHMEFVCSAPEKAQQIRAMTAFFDIDAKTVKRKKYNVVYIKEGDQIVDMLAVMGAGRSLMELENVRIIRGMRGTVNRKVNCETANINKTVSAAVEQIDDILFLQDSYGLDRLPDDLRQVAYARLEHPDATLKELGESLDPPVGKSGVNHRMRKLKGYASYLRENKEEDL